MPATRLPLLIALALAAGATGVVPALAQVHCARCHGDPEFLSGKGGTLDEDAALLVGPELFAGTKHGQLGCLDCHFDYDAGYPHQPDRRTADCSSCHREAGSDWAVSAHGANAQGDAPSCVRCHGVHRILGRNVRESPIHPLNEASLCAECHDDPNIVAAYFADPADSVARRAIESYHETVHGLALERAGLVVSATCSDCHGPHRILGAHDPASSLYRDNVPATCGNCHRGVTEKYATSSHGLALAEGRATPEGHAAPVCTSCHRSHGVAEVREPWKAEVVEECGACHERLYETYFESYHGKIVRLGGGLTAKCSDCHTPHGNLAVDDPRSTVHPANLVTTCGQCHPESNGNFVQYRPHGDHRDREKYPAMFWTYTAMSALLLGTLSFFGVHSTLWLVRSAVDRIGSRSARAAGGKDGP